MRRFEHSFESRRYPVFHRPGKIISARLRGSLENFLFTAMGSSAFSVRRMQSDASLPSEGEVQRQRTAKEDAWSCNVLRSDPRTEMSRSRAKEQNLFIHRTPDKNCVLLPSAAFEVRIH